jgi:ice-binding like protein
MSGNSRLSMGRWIRGSVVAAAAVALAGGALVAATVNGPSLGAARTFAVLGASTVTNTGLTVITGDVGVSPGTAITGFPPGVVTGGTLHSNDTLAVQAHSDAATAYLFLEGMASIPANNLSGTDLGGLTLEPGVYKFNSSAQLTGDLVLDAGGNSNALFVFQIGSTLTTGTGATVTVINGGGDYDESRIFWQIGSSATLGVNTEFTGVIIAYSSITVVSGTSIEGAALAINGAVTLDTNNIVSPSLTGGNGNGNGNGKDDCDCICHDGDGHEHGNGLGLGHCKGRGKGHEKHGN